MKGAASAPSEACCPPAREVSSPRKAAPAWLRDYRQRWGGPALAVVQPDSTTDVAAVVRWCVEHDAVVVPQGGNTGLTGASVPLGVPLSRLPSGAPPASADKAPSDAPDPSQARTTGGADVQPRPVILLSLSRMQQVRSVDALASTMVVEAGCTLQAAQEAAAAHGRLFPLSLASEGSCTIGCARTIPAMTCVTCSSAPRVRWASSRQPC